MTYPAPPPAGATPPPASASQSADPTPAPPTGQPTPDPNPAGSPADDRPLGPAGEKALAAEREARKALERELAGLAPLKRLAEAIGGQAGDSGKTDVQLLQERFEKQEEALAEERTARWRAEIASEKRLTAGQARFLAGKTRDELAASADELLAAFPGGATPPGASPGATPEPPKPKAPAPDPTQGNRGGTPTARPTSLGAAVAAALKPR